MPPDEVSTPAGETPTSDALSGGSTPAETTETQSTEGQTPAVDKTQQAAIMEAARKLAMDETLPERASLRAEKRAFKQQLKTFEQQQAQLRQQFDQMQAELSAAEANPFAWAAKRRGVTEADVYNERTQRAIDPTAAELDGIKRELETERQERKRLNDEQQIRQQRQYQAQLEQNFSTEVIHIATTAPELKYLRAGLEEGDYKQENIAAEVMKRVRAHYNAAVEEKGEGEILDPKEALQTIERELREEAKRKAARLAKLEAAGQPATPDREGAVKAATHEASSSSGPRTLTNAHASQTSGSQRPMTRRERLIDAERFLRAGPATPKP